MPDGVQVTGPMGPRFDEVLTSEALDFLADLHRRFDARRRELLTARDTRYAALAAGGTLDFLPETQGVRDGDWQVAMERASDGVRIGEASYVHVFVDRVTRRPTPIPEVLRAAMQPLIHPER